MKKCTTCGEIKPLDDFYTDKRATDKRCSSCKDCCRAACRKYYNKNSSSVLARTKAYRKRDSAKWNAYGRKWHADNRETHNEQLRKHYAENISQYQARNLKKYGLTLEQYQQMLHRQGGVCAICDSKPDSQNLHVDHCHTTGIVRGLLCFSCNTAIGHFRENLNVMAKAIHYLSINRQGL